MRVVVRLAGESIPWRYRDSDRLGHWLDDTPWAGPPAVKVLRVADTSAAPAVLSALRDAVAAADRGRTGVCCDELDPAAVAGEGFRAASGAHLGVPAGRPALEYAAAAGRACAARPAVWLVPPLPADRPQAVGEATQFADLLAKAYPSARLVVLFADTPAVKLGGFCFDLSEGTPAAGSDLLCVAPDRLWPHYLHRRLAWEAGGHLPRAERLAAVATRVRPGDDGGLEAALNASAVAAHEALGPAGQAATAAGVAACVGRAGVAAALPAGAFWSPTHLAGTLPVPWVARALLLRQPVGPFEQFLRGALLCLPIVQELLTTCFLLETQVRGRADLAQPPPDDSPSHGHWGRFRAGRGMTATLTPPGCPAAPSGPWAFASLGEIIARDDPAARQGDWRHEVRDLRNHLAHGHHVGWDAIRLARRLATRLRG